MNKAIQALFCVLILSLSGCSDAGDASPVSEVVSSKPSNEPDTPSLPTTTSGSLTDSIPSDDDATPSWKFPQTRTLGENTLVLHAPQIVKWDEFKRYEALMAVELTTAGTNKPILASLELSGETLVDLDERTVIVTNPRVDKVNFVNEGTPEIEEALRGATQNNRLEIPVDIFLFSLASDAVDLPETDGLSQTPPVIKIMESPTLLLFVNGDPVKQNIENTSLSLVVNANWPVVHDASEDQYYLLNKDTWQSSPDLAGDWSSAIKLPAEVASIDIAGEFSKLRAAYPLKAPSGNIPAIFFTSEPTELIVLEGKPVFEQIPETGGLQFVNNTVSPLFFLDDSYYFLTSGRWFKSQDLAHWKFTSDLPEEFSLIPVDHGMAYVRSSVAGTLEARLAILEALLPVENTVTKDEVLEIDIEFDGEPEFQDVTAAGVSRAVNTPLDIIRYQNVYYLCYEGAWYQADSPTGSWSVAYRVPDAIYDIPATSPSYPVTQVQVAATTPTTVTYAATQGYNSGIYVSYGVPVYGTGWYYPPYAGLFYYSLFMSYGHGNYYNPHSGRYTTRSVWHGPYGGYSYNEFANPRTGRYGFVETAWDGDEWGSYGESYNPRTGVYSETERYYDDDKQRFEMERESTRNGKTLVTEREVDINDGWSETTRQTSDGANSVVTRQQQEDGSITKQGNVTTADGRSAEITGGYENGKSTTTIKGSEGKEGTIERSRDSTGVSREGSFSNASGDTLQSSTQRDGYNTRTELESSSGAKAISRSDGDSRATIALDAQGDLYASKDGNVYKKSSDGWQEYNGGNNSWQETNNRRSDTQSTRDTASAGASVAARNSSTATDRYDRNSAQLQRDARARQGGYNQFHQRRNASANNRSRTGGFGRARGGGIGRR